MSTSKTPVKKKTKTKKKTWEDLTHEQKIRALQSTEDAELITTYKPGNVRASDFERTLTDWRTLFSPDSVGKVQIVKKPPRKDHLLGAIRDLNKIEALLELIDNSIDAYLGRKKDHPNHTPEELLIYINLNERADTLFYEDNAGGVPADQLMNLVVPGYSKTSDMSATIGSYKTGGKKAIFRLADNVVISTRHDLPGGGVDDAHQVHIDNAWVDDQTNYEFPVYVLKNKGDILKGRTIYRLKLRNPEEWDAKSFSDIMSEVRRTYTLLLVRNPNIKIHLFNRASFVLPAEDLYKFTDGSSDDFDLKPQKVTFKTKLNWRGYDYGLEIELIVGCRTTSGGRSGDDNWGLDLYGNDRLFRAYDQDELISSYGNIPKSAVRQYFRGLINIKGPNVFVPWDTHKRHLNADREVIDLIKTHPAIRGIINEWGSALSALSEAESIKALIGDRMTPAFKTTKGVRDIHVAYSSTVDIPKGKKNKLPESVHKPLYPDNSSKAKNTVDIKLVFTKEEFRRAAGNLGIAPLADSREGKRLLGQTIKQRVLKPSRQ